MKKLILAAACFTLILSGCGGSKNNSEPASTVEPSAPVISQVSQKPLGTKAGTGVPWDGSTKACTITTDLTFGFYISDADSSLISTVTLTWEDSLGVLSGSRIDNYDIYFNSNQRAYINIPSQFNAGIPDAAGKANCSDTPRTYTYWLSVTDETDKTSNIVTRTFTVTE